MRAPRIDIIEIELGGEIIAVELSRKRIKSMNLRVSADGEVKASAPYATPLFAVRAFIMSRREWLGDALTRQRAHQSAAAPADEPRGGGFIRLHGENVPIVVTEAKKASVSHAQGALIVSVPLPLDAQAVEKAIDKWQRAEAARYLTALTEETLPLFAKYRVKMPSITIKRMKTRWGSCSTNKAHVNYNIRLLSVSEAAARYVVAHELAHFVVPRHDRAFYAVVSEVMPDWKRRKALLKNERII